MTKVSLGPARRFGVRYGRTIREKVAIIESELRKKHVCPYCKYPRVHRLAIGIWECRKCHTTFTGKAYTVGKAPATREQKEEAQNGAV